MSVYKQTPALVGRLRFQEIIRMNDSARFDSNLRLSFPHPSSILTPVRRFHEGWLMTHWHARPRATTTDEREQLVQEIVPLLRAREEVIFAYLHGSFITREAFRDVDLALYVTATSVLNMNLRRYEVDTGVDFTVNIGWRLRLSSSSLACLSESRPQP
jgi:hypothetical protein